MAFAIISSPTDYDIHSLSLTKKHFSFLIGTNTIIAGDKELKLTLAAGGNKVMMGSEAGLTPPPFQHC